MGNKLIKISPKDSVAVALTEIKKGEIIYFENKELTSLDTIPFGHKIALTDIKKGSNIIKYGQPIGHALTDIKRGEHIHTHN